MRAFVLKWQRPGVAIGVADDATPLLESCALLPGHLVRGSADIRWKRRFRRRRLRATADSQEKNCDKRAIHRFRFWLTHGPMIAAPVQGDVDEYRRGRTRCSRSGGCFFS